MNVLLLMLKLKVTNVFVLRVKCGKLGNSKIWKIRRRINTNLMNLVRHIVKHLDRNILVIVVKLMYMYHLRKSNVHKVLNVRCAWNQRRKEEITLVLNVTVKNKFLMLIQTHVKAVKLLHVS